MLAHSRPTRPYSLNAHSCDSERRQTQKDYGFEISALGDDALCLSWPAGIDISVNRQVHSLASFIRERAERGVLDVVPTYHSVAVSFDKQFWCVSTLEAAILEWLACTSPENWLETKPSVIREIPVCYHPSLGPDLAAVATHCQLSEDELVRRHSCAKYHVYFLGFLPGFAYLGGLDPRLHTPRKSQPRTMVPSGSVGIGGEQTGIYPMSSPGGWQLIGQTPLNLFDLSRSAPCLLQAGDTVQFCAIDLPEFERIQLAEQAQRR